jgi:pyridoxal phosphate enzyme (YggS family)
MTRLITGLDLARVRANLEAVEAEIAQACDRVGRDPAGVEVLAAAKYVAVEELPVLRDAGITLVGENRAQDLERKVAEHGTTFTWDFIGHLQSRKVKQVLPHVRLIHSVAGDSVIRELGRHAQPGTEVLVEVNVSGEEGKSGVAPEGLDDVIARCREEGGVEVVGLMTMPPLAEGPEASRPWFRVLAQLAADRALRHLSMGTTQDFPVAVEEGATIVRIGTRLYM